MPSQKIRHLPEIQSHKDPIIRKIGESLIDILRAMQSTSEQTGVAPSNTSATPSPPSAINVIASNGIADVQIFHNDPVFRDINYFVEYSKSPGFPVALTHVVDLGSSRNKRIPIFMGATLIYFRAYCQYSGSQPSAPVVFGSPTGVNCGGSGPSMQAGQSSGTGNALTDSGVGSGIQLTRTVNGVGPKL